MNHLTIRDDLRCNPTAAAAYGVLEEQLAEQFHGPLWPLRLGDAARGH